MSLIINPFAFGAAAPAGDWWAAGGATGCVLAVQPKGAADYAASKLDLSGNGNHVTDGVAADWDATNGWTFSSNKYLITPVVPATDRSWSAIVRFSGGGSTVGKLFGSESLYFGIYPNYLGTIYYDNCYETSTTPGLNSGRLAFAGLKAYRDGVDEGLTGGSSLGGTARAIYIGASHTSGGPNAYWAGSIYALAVYDNTLSAGQVAAIDSAAAAL